MSFTQVYVEQRKLKRVFFAQINKIINWNRIDKIIRRHYNKGQSVAGSPAYPGLLLFKMNLLQTWYGLSDYEVEYQVNDSLSFMEFTGLTLEDSVPDHSVISRFRTELTKKGVYENLFREINKQLEQHNIIVKRGAIVDASITDTPRKPKGKTTYEITTDREETRNEEEIKKEEVSHKILKRDKPGVDSEARWLKKGKKLHYGYKKHHICEDTEGLILGVKTTPANVNEVTNLEEVIDTTELPKNIPFSGDKGYTSKKNRELLKAQRLKDRIQKKAVRGKPLTQWEKKFNTLISKIRYKVERTFGSIKRWFGGGKARYIGIEKTHTQHLLEAMSYNLYRSPGIIISNAVKQHLS